jgi:23S rRNA (cytosine1962-C5)-methyltransferase
MVQVILGRGKARRVEAGHPWVYSNEIERISADVVAGEIVEVFNFKQQYIGTGYINTLSQLTVRLLTRQRHEVIDQAFFRTRLMDCRKYREKLGYTENYRLVFGEGDFLPALVIDKFGTVYVLQTQSAGMDRWKQTIANILIADFGATGVFERNDMAVRKLEGLEETKGFLSPPFPTAFVMDELGVRFHIDIEQGQKTGFFLDQKENRQALANIVKDATVLDCFTYTGSFAMFAAKYGAKEVTALDISEDAIQQTNKNALLNGFNQVHTLCANAFDILPEWSKAGKKYDVVILDPPAFTKNRKSVDAAMKGYKEINIRGMKMIHSGGFLLTFSCSHFMSPDLFFEVIQQAASDAGKTIREVRYLTQSKDHPIVWGIEETYYLKGFLLQVI